MGFDYVLAHREHQYLATETNWTTFQVPWESIAATCLGPSIARRTVESRPLGTSWISSRSSSRARSARGPPVVSFATSTGRSESHQASTLTCCSTDICSLGRTRSGWCTSRRTSLCLRRRRGFSRAGARGRAEDRTACPSIRKSGDCWIMFHDRDLLERRPTASFDKRQLDHSAMS